MKATDPGLPTAIMQKVMAHADFHVVADIVRRNTSGKIYLVGGKVYRTAIELIHGYKCNSEGVDWDFLCIGEVVEPRRAYVRDDWVPNEGEYDGSKANSMCLKHYSTSNSNYTPQSIFSPTIVKKIDIIGIKDVMLATANPTGQLEDYLNIVPLTVQSIALSADSASYPSLYGRVGMKSIETRTVAVNNEIGALGRLNVPKYLRQKAENLQFYYAGSNIKRPCNCFPNDTQLLWRLGCQSKLTHI